MRFTSMFVAALPFIGSVFAAPLAENALTPVTSDLTKKDVDVLSVITELQTRVVSLFAILFGLQLKDGSLPPVLSVPTLPRLKLLLASMLSSTRSTGVVTSSALTFRLASVLAFLYSVVTSSLRMCSPFLYE